MPFEWKSIANLTLGVNYRNLVASRTSLPGEAQDALDVFPREDGSIEKSFGWLRRNPTALTGKPLAAEGFTYRGKNTVVGDVRAGNLGIANSGADFTRRQEEYPGFLVLTDSTAYVWDPPTEAFVEVNPATQPQAFTIQPETKPTVQVAQDNCYVVGWTTVNLRFDPTDRLWYQWNWEEVPPAPAVTAGAGDLIGGATYGYGVTYQDNYTGEESAMSPLASITMPAGGGGAVIDVSSAIYAGDRHFDSGGTASDVSVTVWRTGADDNSPRFLDLLLPGVTTLVDDGLARETSLRPYRGEQVDEPRFSSLKLFKGRFYALSKTTSSNRAYFSHFDRAQFLERFRPLDFRDLSVPEGEVLTAIGGTDATLLIYSQRGASRASVSVTPTTQSVGFNRMPWHVGAVGPQARATIDGWEYFVSERGPYRWREGQTGPQNIGENLLPIFVDQSSGLCKLNPIGKEKTEVNFDWTSNTVVMTFALGPSEDVNTHMRYWIESQRINGDYTYGWFPASPDIQAMDLSSALVGMQGGAPVSPRTKKQEIIWCDSLGYVYEYQLSAKRGGLDPTQIVVTTVVSVDSANEITVADTPLYNVGDGMTGLRLEIESQPAVNGVTTSEAYVIDSNDTSQIKSATDFTRTPNVGDLVYLAGIPAFWRSWFDHFGQPHQHKTMMDFSLGYQDRNNPAGSIIVSVGAGEFPDDFRRMSRAVMNKNRKKFTVSTTGVYFMYQFENTKPDQLFLVSDFDREVELVPARRKA